jgi:glyoxylase-like metal-dependent hydrolase (beta-lactamase superfamily II)
VKELAPGLWNFDGLMMGRSYLVVGDDGLTIIDASLAGSAAKVARQLRRNGYEPRDVKTILVTHAHPDHVGGLPELKAMTGARVLVGERDREVAEGLAPMVRPPRSEMSHLARLMTVGGSFLKGTPVDETLAVGDVVPVGGGLQVLFTPGHSPGHVSFWQPEKRWLFCGDVMMNLRGLGLPFAAFTADMDENRRSVARLAELEPELVLFGHGRALPNAAGAIRAFARKVAVARPT